MFEQARIVYAQKGGGTVSSALFYAQYKRSLYTRERSARFYPRNGCRRSLPITPSRVMRGGVAVRSTMVDGSRPSV